MESGRIRFRGGLGFGVGLVLSGLEGWFKDGLGLT